MTYKVENVPELNGYTVEWAEPGNFYLSRRNVIYHSPDLKHPFSRVAEIAAPFWKNAASRLRLAQRLLRFQVTNVIPFGNGEIFVTFDKSVGVIKENQFRHLDGLVRPCRVLRGACAVTPRDEVYFGEYLANNERGEMRIYKYSPGHDELENVFTFPPNSIKHIHGIYYDQFSDALFCLTGDDEKECRIMRSDDGFRTLQVVGEGDETWRAVSILFKENSMFYGMDAEFRTNHLYEVDRETYQRKASRKSVERYFTRHGWATICFSRRRPRTPQVKPRMWRRFGTSIPQVIAPKLRAIKRTSGIRHYSSSGRFTFRA